MKSFAGKGMLCAALALAAACSSKPLDPDAGASGSGGIGNDGGSMGGAGAATDAGGATDGSQDALLGGRRSFVVTANISLASGGPTGAPTSHVFTMVVDGDSGTAILGANGQGSVSPIEPTAAGFRVIAPQSFSFAGDAPWFVSYTDLSFAVDPSGLLRGNSSGQLSLNAGGGCNMLYAGNATMSLTGVLDTLAPVFSIAAAGDLADPFTSFGVVSSEPLPGQTPHPALRAAGGDTVVLAPSFTTPDAFVALFSKPSIVLRYGEQYRIDISGSSDFAANAAVSPTIDGLGFTTVAAPPLVASDGFESATGPTLGGAQVLSGAGDPIINGTHSLYVPPAVTFTSPVTKTQLALRLAAAPGATVLHFAYRIVNPADPPNSYLAVGSVGGSIGGADFPSGSGGTTPATIAGTQVSLGPVATAAIDLPADATGEIILELIAHQAYCKGFPSSPTAGLIIDDLRAE